MKNGEVIKTGLGQNQFHIYELTLKSTKSMTITLDGSDDIVIELIERKPGNNYELLVYDDDDDRSPFSEYSDRSLIIRTISSGTYIVVVSSLGGEVLYRLEATW